VIVARVLLVDLERVWRGGQEQALLLMTGLKRRGHGTELLAVRDSAVALRAQAAGIRLHAIGGSARQIGAARRLREVLPQKRFDVLYANEAHALTAAWLAGSHRQLPLVAARRVVFPLSPSPFALRRYRAAARILAISQAVRNQLLAAGLDATRIEVVPDGVEIPGPVTPQARENARKRWGFRTEETVVECVGALTAEKGHALLIEAFAKLRQEAPNCADSAAASAPSTNRTSSCTTPGNYRLLIAGEGPLRAQLERQTREAGLQSAILFAGFVPDVEFVYAAGDLFVFPSLQEGAGSSLLRAMAYGLPVLAVARGGIAEIIEDGRNGVLVREVTAEALVRAAARMLRDSELRERISRAARVTVASRYSVDRMVDETARIFEELLSGRPAAGGK
jgi:glycosyltransferase involved in cell wall biosynthesis